MFTVETIRPIYSGNAPAACVLMLPGAGNLARAPRGTPSRPVTGELGPRFPYGQVDLPSEGKLIINISTINNEC